MNSLFAHMHNDSVYVQSPDGARFGPYKTKIGTDNAGHSATVFDSSFEGQEGWVLIRELPGSREEKYLIHEANYSSGVSGIPPHWSLKLRKDASLMHRSEPKAAPTITINNSQGIQIGDYNVQHIASSLQGLVQMIEKSTAAPEEKEAAKGLLIKLLESPVIASVLGGVTAGVTAYLKNSN
ncbi:RIP homotypic interaction motif-containing protein [Burkholderia stagnalis]|uniref:RIP homotypic interaction motif-containing protein n=1 Tax=Burkholderia stagnalis TaxID=1503054 RepID=UPI0009BF2379|nr:RIP homotypic interaction motif-containing protein [Burkholderia stagnalis]